MVGMDAENQIWENRDDAQLKTEEVLSEARRRRSSLVVMEAWRMRMKMKREKALKKSSMEI